MSLSSPSGDASSQGLVAEPVRKEAPTNTTSGSLVQSTHVPQPAVFFRPDAGEFVFVPLTDITVLENECRLLDATIGQFHSANHALEVALVQAQQQGAQPFIAHSESERARKALENAYADAMAARKKLYGKLKPLAKLDSGRNAVIELLPIGTGQDASGQPTRWLKSKKMTYVRSDKVKSHWRTYPLRGDQSKSGNKSFIKKDETGRHKIDKKEFVRGVSELKRKYKTEWLKVEEHAVQGVLFDWADAWNKNLSWDYAKNNPDGALAQNVDLSASAQLMRYLAGVGLSSEFDPLKGNCAIKASARAEFAVAEAKAAAALYMPDRLGWIWSLQGDDGKIYPLGAIRFKAELALTGAAGASIVAEGSLAVDFKDEKRKDVFGVKGSGEARSSPGSAGRGIVVNGKPVDSGASVELEVFAGAKADIKLVGAIQWLNPEKMTADYQDFAKVGPSVAGLAGIGAGLLLELTYVAGKFRLTMMASACLGLGAKGKFELEVDAQLLGEFACWFFYQLYHANFQKLTFVRREAFLLLVRIQALVIDGAVDGFKRIEDFVDRSAGEIQIEFEEFVRALEKEERRVRLMERVLSQPGLLLRATPEAKGILLYQLSRHDWRLDGLDARNHGSLAYYGKRKRAVKAVLRCAHTRRDFDNTIQHMHPRGEKGNLEKNKMHIMSFLNMAVIGQAPDDDEMLNYYDNLRASLKATPSVGYPVVPNDTTQYALQRDGSEVHPLQASLANIPLTRIA